MPEHPAKFTPVILSALQEIVNEWAPSDVTAPRWTVLDPFAGTGRIHELVGCRTFGIEMEQPWADMHPRTKQGDATALPYKDKSFDAWISSIVYGNRMSDHWKAKDPSKRHSYTFTMRRGLDDPDYELQPNNAGLMFFWNEDWKELHRKAFAEAIRVTRSLIVVNCKNFYRTVKGVEILEQPVEWVEAELIRQGCEIVERRHVPVRGLTHGSTRNRVDHEAIVIARPPMGPLAVGGPGGKGGVAAPPDR